MIFRYLILQTHICPETWDGGCSEKRLNWHAFSPVSSALLAFVLNTAFFRFKIFACKTNYEKTGLQAYMFATEICYLFGCTEGKSATHGSDHETFINSYQLSNPSHGW
jgi:hypothetical protein